MLNDLLDATFMILYEKNHRIIPTELSGYLWTKGLKLEDKYNPIALLERIVEIDFADKNKNLSATLSHHTDMFFYSIKVKGIEFVDNLPDNFLNKPYSFFIITDKNNLATSKKSTMNYQHEILKTLVAHNVEIDIATLMSEFTKDISDSEKPTVRNKIAYEILTMYELKYIGANFSPHTDLFKYFNTQSWMQEREEEFGLSDTDMKITITDDGMIRLRTLNELYNPNDPLPHVEHHYDYSIKAEVISGSVLTTGGIKDSVLTDSFKVNEESQETKELVKEQLKDLPVNKSYRKRNFILGILAICLTIIGILISKGCSK